jgi:hypothetical protein
LTLSLCGLSKVFEISMCALSLVEDLFAPFSASISIFDVRSKNYFLKLTLNI